MAGPEKEDIKMRVGNSGHQRLDDPSKWQWVEAKIDSVLADFAKPLIGVTSLAIGADQAFANLVLKHGGTLEVIIPFQGYESTFNEGRDRQSFQGLLGKASHVEILKKTGSDEEAYFEAGKLVVDRTELMIAVWNGKPAAGLGGTGDVVEYARKNGKPIIWINPLEAP